ncbi:MAG: CBS domain-containing protein [Eubacteriales bacterium]|nr:CBS domain-containing protein [Eubacteriales bacterium]
MPYSQEAAEQFLQLYNRLDKFMRMLAQSSPSTPHAELLDRIRKYELNGTIAYSRNNEFLKDMARLRNTIVHNPKEDAEVIALPLQSVVERYAALIDKAMSPPSCMQIAIPRASVLSAGWHDRIGDTARRMRKAEYSHIPILKDDVVLGVFSESSLYTYFALRGELVLDESATIADLAGVTALDAHSSECFRFLPASADMDDLLDLFQNIKHGRKRLVMVFVTHDGRPTGRLVGILTAWDVLRYTVQQD